MHAAVRGIIVQLPISFCYQHQHPSVFPRCIQWVAVASVPAVICWWQTHINNRHCNTNHLICCTCIFTCTTPWQRGNIAVTQCLSVRHKPVLCRNGLKTCAGCAIQASFNLSRMLLLGSYVQHGSPTTSHCCFVTFIGNECHSGSSSNEFAVLVYRLPGSAIPCTRTVPCGRHGLSSSTPFRFDARAARSTDASRQRRRPRLRSLRSSRLERPAIWRHHVAIAHFLQTTAQDTALQPLIWSLTVWLLFTTCMTLSLVLYYLLLSALEVYLTPR